MKRWTRAVCAAAAVAGAALAAGAAPAGFDFRRGFSEVAERATPAVVFIQVEKQVPMGGATFFFNNPFDLFGEEFSRRFFGWPGGGRGRQFPERRRQTFRQTGQGSGFLITKDGYILTNTHVVGDAEKITVRLADGREFKAKRIGADPKTEVALVKIECDKDLPFLKAGDPEKLKTGEWVIAIGNPFGLKETLTVGVVSAKGRSGMGITDYEDFIQTDAAINPGNSGGPLLNVDGDVVGINTAIYSRSGGYMGIGFAIPIDMAVNIKDQLLATGKVTRGYVGVLLNPGELTDSLAREFGFEGNEGVLIADAVEGGPAEKAGVRAGDIVVKLNGRKVKDKTQFRNEVARIMPGKKAELVLMRDGREKRVSVTVAAYPDEEGGGEGAGGAGGETPEALLDRLGLELRNLTPELADELGLKGARRGAAITEVTPGSPAEDAGLEAGMVIVAVDRKDVRNVADVKRLAARAKGGSLLLRVRTPQGSFFKSLRIDD